MIRYEASGSTAWDSTMDVRKRPNWLKSAENKTFAPKPQRLAVVPPSTTEDDEEDKNNDVGSSTVLVEVSNEQEGDIDRRAGSTLEQFETLKQRQQEQMQALLLQQTQVWDSRELASSLLLIERPCES